MGIQKIADIYGCNPIEGVLSHKMKRSRYIFNEINSKHPTMPFTIREFDEQRARMGVVECFKHELLSPYPVLYEAPDEFLAHIKLTVLITATNTMKITQGPRPECKSDKVIEDEEVKTILSSSTKRKAAKKEAAAKVEDKK